ncbi:hypothetical protein JW964_19895 [candidate division KSB1 bacterium]|nr:hypothetical protein [candidate division KSB1 bacterium]
MDKDKTGRSIPGQQYVNSLMKWLGDYSPENPDYFNNELNHDIAKWLGDKNPDKERIVRLLIARLTWDWKAYEKYQQENKFEELQLQVCRMDICHYAFPKHLNFLLQGIGRMEPINNFEGCGSFNTDIKTYIEEQFSILCDYLRSTRNNKNSNRDEKIQLWLIASLAKTLKEQVGLKKFSHQLINLK